MTKKYRVGSIPKGLKDSYHSNVRAGSIVTTVKSDIIIGKNVGLMDKVDVITSAGKRKKVYAFQLVRKR